MVGSNWPGWGGGHPFEELLLDFVRTGGRLCLSWFRERAAGPGGGGGHPLGHLVYGHSPSQAISGIRKLNLQWLLSENSRVLMLTK